MDLNNSTYKEFGLRLRTIAEMRPDGMFLQVYPPKDTEMRWFMRLIADIDLGAPWVYITPEGELFTQWDFKKYEIEGYFNFDKTRIQLEVYSKDTIEFIVEAVYNFKEASLAERMASFLVKFKD